MEPSDAGAVFGGVARLLSGDVGGWNVHRVSVDASDGAVEGSAETGRAHSGDRLEFVAGGSDRIRLERAPVRLPDTVNIGRSIWKPSIAADGTIYFTNIDNKGGKWLYSARLVQGSYEMAQPLPFSDGTKADVDAEIAPDGSFLVFCSAGRLGDTNKDQLFLVRRNGAGWGEVERIRYEGDEKPYGSSTDDEPRLGPDHRTLYFSSDRAVVVHFPRTREMAEKDLERLDSWDNSNNNVWSISLMGLISGGGDPKAGQAS
jgi:hypothetical protein